MALPATKGTRYAAVIGAGALAASLLVSLPNTADAAHPCRIDVTTRLDKTQKFAGKSVAKYYWAHANGSAVGQYDSKANVIMTTFPTGAYPALINEKIGERDGVGAMTKKEAPKALGSINGDFFITPDIRYVNDIEMARGPMVKNGQIIRAFHHKQRVVGVDKKMLPFGGMMGVAGFVQAQVTGASRVKVRAVNWHTVPGKGVTIYTPDWSQLTRGDGKAAVPRPAGAVEWVIDSHNTITSVRNARRNTGKLGDPVANGTRVIAFSDNTASDAAGVPVGTQVRVRPRQTTDTHVQLLTAVGRGLPVIEGGKPGPLGCRSYARTASAFSSRPRTFVGWDANGRWRSFIVPGSKLENVNNVLLRTGGFGLASAANIAKQLGMTYAYELDGGGSTTFWTRSKRKWTRKDLYRVANPSGCTCERWMANGLAFVQPQP
ncbi:MAG: phosphodiester glycosidase family protein [Actinomycetes bacterium]